jgi:hypothetical protein
MRYKAKNIAALDFILTGLPDKMRVDVGPGIAIRAKTVGELPKVDAWPENSAILTSLERDSSGTLKVSKANVATRMSPKQ